MTALRKANQSRTLVILGLLSIFLGMLYCNLLTPLKGDDFLYLYSFKDGSRIERVSDIFVSMRYHRLSMNGRVIPHFFAQLFLLLPLPVFKLLNAGVFTLFILLMYGCAFCFSHSGNQRRHNVLLLCSIMGAVWVLSPDFGTIYLWLDGACNYLWSAVVLFLWLFIMAKDFMEDISMTLPEEILFAILALAVGNFSENSSVSAVFVMLLFLALSLFYSKRKCKRWHITSLCAMLMGFLLLAFAPAELDTKIAEPSFYKYFYNLLALLGFYLKFWPLLLLYGFSYWYSVRTKQEQKVRILSLVFIGGSLAAHFVLVFARYVEARSSFLAFSFLLLACGLLFCQLFTTKARGLYCCLSVVLLAFTLHWGFVGVQDLRLVHYKWTYNDEYIKAELASGSTKVKVPYIMPATHYSCLYEWGYLKPKSTSYVNVAMAKYYGLEELSGYWFYELDAP